MSMFETFGIIGAASINVWFMLRVEHRLTKLEDVVKLCTGCENLEVKRSAKTSK